MGLLFGHGIYGDVFCVVIFQALPMDLFANFQQRSALPHEGDMALWVFGLHEDQVLARFKTTVEKCIFFVLLLQLSNQP